MEKVLIIGATGSLARYVIDALKELDNISLTLFTRNKNGLAKQMVDGCRIIEGDAVNYATVKRLSKGKTSCM